ncbi:MAG TPA: TadE/TadG family type IV pilus assembly protein [Roseovarius sp.]|nr:TadE/TadG family type IV pilus assembly protein [Roseovarius sp.]
MIRFIKTRIARMRGEETGSASVEFVIMFPIFFLFMLFSLELGIVTYRHALLERALDLTVRGVRLTTGEEWQHDDIKTGLCKVSLLGSTCMNDLKLEMKKTDIRNYAGLDPQADCTDKSETVAPVYKFTNGDSNDLMLIRACLKYDPLFPGTVFGKAINKDSSGQGMIVSVSAFVQEPDEDWESDAEIAAGGSG